MKRANYKLCHHCNKELNIKRFKEHERLFFNKDANEWMKDTDIDAAEDGAAPDSNESDFSSFDGNEWMIDGGNCNQDGCGEVEDLFLTDNDLGNHDDSYGLFSCATGEAQRGTTRYFLLITTDLLMLL